MKSLLAAEEYALNKERLLKKQIQGMGISEHSELFDVLDMFSALISKRNYRFINEPYGHVELCYAIRRIQYHSLSHRAKEAKFVVCDNLWFRDTTCAVKDR